MERVSECASLDPCERTCASVGQAASIDHTGLHIDTHTRSHSHPHAAAGAVDAGEKDIYNKRSSKFCRLSGSRRRRRQQQQREQRIPLVSFLPSLVVARQSVRSFLSLSLTRDCLASAAALLHALFALAPSATATLSLSLSAHHHEARE